MASKLADCKKDQIVLFLISSEKYVSTNNRILKYYINNKKCYCVYITVNRAYVSLMNLFGKERIDTKKMFIIDAITPLATGVQRAGNVVFIGSPNGLTNISITATEALKSMPKENRILFLDSLSALILYNSAGSVAKFTHFLANRMKAWDIGGAVISMEKETDEKMISQLSQFCDKVVKL